MKSKTSVFGALLFIGAAMLALNMLTPEFIDDFWYKFKFVRDSSYTTEPITTFREVLISQYNHYFSSNGRVVVHTIVQTFTALLGKEVFNFFNAAVFVCFIWLLARLGRKVDGLNLLFVFSVVLLCMPFFGDAMLWMTGSVNYLWTITAVYAFLLAVERLKDEPLRMKHILWGVVSVLVGCSHEGITFPLAVSLAVYVAVKRKSLFNKAAFPLIVGFVVGALVCTFAPGTMERASVGGGMTLSLIMQKLNSGLTVCLKLILFPLCMCVMAVKCFFAERGRRLIWLKEFWRDNFIVFNAMILSFGVIFASGFMSIRAGAGVEIFSLILLVGLLRDMPAVFKWAVCGVGVSLYAVILVCSVYNRRDSQSVIEQIERGNSSIIVFKDIHYPPLMHRYIIPAILRTYDKTSIWSELVSAAYHCDRLAFIPDTLYDDIVSGSDKLNDIKKQGDYPQYVIPQSEDEPTMQPVFLLRPTDFDALPFYIRPFATRLERYSVNELPAQEYCVLNIDGKNYLFVSKNLIIDNRVSDIRYIHE